MVRWGSLVTLVFLVSLGLAQEPAKKPITLEVMMSGKLGAARMPRGGGKAANILGWAEDGKSYITKLAGKTVLVNVADGTSQPYVATGEFAKSLKTIPGLKEDAIADMLTPPISGLTVDKKAMTLKEAGQYYVAFADGSPAMKFPKLGDKQVLHLTFSPDGRYLAFVREGNIFTAKAGDTAVTQQTTDGGKNDILNGTADWVYEEEIFNRRPQSFWWSPDSKQIAFMRYDDTPVVKFPITGMLKTGGDLEKIDYPKAGAPNPTVKIGVLNVAAKSVQFLNLGQEKPTNLVVSRVGWLNTPKPVPMAYLQDRVQSYLDFATWPDITSEPKTLFRDTTKAWVEDLGEPKFLPDGTMLIQSERTGFKHIYHYQTDGKLIRPLTSGDYEARVIERIDTDYVYFTGTKDGHNRNSLCRAKLDGTGVELLSTPGFSHAINLGPKGPYYVSTFSNIDTPPETALFEAGKSDAVRVLTKATPNPLRDEYSFGKVERVSVPMKDGFVCAGVLTYPPNFDPAKKYPLWLMTYAGPHTPTVSDTYSLKINEQVLANAGIVVFNFDPRPASGQGAASAWTAYKQLGVQELKDLEEAIGWVMAKGWLDEKRVGIQGHSYGGYMTAYALTHSKVFSAGISGAPVTDWALYDTIYTERYMGLPQENKAGYEKSSVVKAAANLHGKLLLIHGMIDDNVHLQNTAQLVHALQRANKDFEVMIYPSSRHGINGGPHYQRLMANFIFKTMEVTPGK
jgi:dipeptidyl-peptidase 4